MNVLISCLYAFLSRAVRYSCSCKKRCSCPLANTFPFLIRFLFLILVFHLSQSQRRFQKYRTLYVVFTIRPQCTDMPYTRMQQLTRAILRLNLFVVCPTAVVSSSLGLCNKIDIQYVESPPLSWNPCCMLCNNQWQLLIKINCRTSEFICLETQPCYTALF